MKLLFEYFKSKSFSFFMSFMVIHVALALGCYAFSELYPNNNVVNVDLLFIGLYILNSVVCILRTQLYYKGEKNKRQLNNTIDRINENFLLIREDLNEMVEIVGTNINTIRNDICLLNNSQEALILLHKLRDGVITHEEFKKKMEVLTLNEKYFSS